MTPHPRIVVISPHLDDALLSLGAAIQHAVHHGSTVEVLTVFAGDVSSQRRAGRWDKAGGYSTAGEAARARRGEDARACQTLGAQPVWLSFGDEQYPRGGQADDILRSVTECTRGADLVLVPGFPLRHRDHRVLARMLAGSDLEAGAVAIYAEQPYAYRAAREPRDYGWRALAVPQSAIDAKGAACRAYHSQIALLPDDMLVKIAEFELRRGGELIRPARGTPERHYSSFGLHIRSMTGSEPTEGA